MRNLMENDDAIRSRRHDDGVPRPLELVAGGSMALMFASLFVMLLLRAPHTVWAVLLAAALTMLAGVIALGLGAAVEVLGRRHTADPVHVAGYSPGRRMGGKTVLLSRRVPCSVLMNRNGCSTSSADSRLMIRSSASPFAPGSGACQTVTSGKR